MKHRLTPLMAIAVASVPGCQLHEGPTFQEGLMRSGVAIEISSSEEEADYGNLSSLGYLGNVSEETNVDTFLIDVTQGYFLNEHLEVGGSFLLSTVDTEFAFKDAGFTLATAGVEEKRFALSGFARYYFTPEGTTRFFAEGKLGWVDGTRDFDGSTSNDFDGFLFGLGAGAATFLTESSALETMLTYRNATLDGSDNVGFSFDIDATEVALLLGYSFYF